MRLRGRKCRRWRSPITAIMFAAANFFNEASKRDVKPIIGCEVYVAKGSRHDRGEKTNGDAGRNGGDRNEEEPGTRGSNHLVLLCEIARGIPEPDQAGFRGISRRLLLQAAHRLRPACQTQQGTDRAVARACEGPVTEAGDEREDTTRRARMRTGCATFSARTISSSKFRIRGWRSRSASIRDLVRLSKETGIPLVATNDCHYLHHERRARAGSFALHSDRQNDERCAPHEIRRPTSFISRRRQRWRRCFASCRMR